MPYMKTLYVGCALRGSPAEFVSKVEVLKKELEQYFEVLHFVGLNAGVSVREIYETDIALAAQADVMLAMVDVPSTGLGMEVARRHELGKPTIIAYHTSSHPSAMVLGVAEVAEHFSVIAYDEEQELVAAMRAYA
jgi:nucleoside 2-deoxyribosyltransferase